MKKINQIIAAGIISLAATQASAGVITVGNELLDRSTSDGWNDFTIGLTEEVLPTGKITSWSTYIERFEGGNDTTIALLALRNTGGSSWSVVGIDEENVSGTGLQGSFDADIDVLAGDILAIWMTDAKVSFDYTSDSVNWSQGGNYQVSEAPLIGEIFNLNHGGDAGNGQRTYSLQATVETFDVPEPSSLGLLGLGLAGLGVVRRRNK